MFALYTDCGSTCLRGRTCPICVCFFAFTYFVRLYVSIPALQFFDHVTVLGVVYSLRSSGLIET
ncbi:hypothetical protein ASPWEDRAFT_648360 [Aspergillus wentii DTO 134E9]|uniref:Uncharacterized protein n=1 Tax=Aspergillus wentii DTO 134E9 TaxID=1073089 RepID=A0A1L9RAY5_ASPWE|nr:uncharacterized protein ASPWEDRAFT_648360 [Aspergillus wentii DTO 134E9]OJJ32079.1 hypothetical protein ASPWEDRAFT_648360 [Aspergillus wentii DTO 134E9]